MVRKKLSKFYIQGNAKAISVNLFSLVFSLTFSMSFHNELCNFFSGIFHCTHSLFICIPSPGLIVSWTIVIKQLCNFFHLYKLHLYPFIYSCLFQRVIFRLTFFLILILKGYLLYGLYLKILISTEFGMILSPIEKNSKLNS